MPRPKDGLKKHTLFLFEGDYDRIRELYPDIPPALAIRTIIRDFIKRKAPPPTNIEVKL